MRWIYFKTMDYLSKVPNVATRLHLSRFTKRGGCEDISDAMVESPARLIGNTVRCMW